ncbi:Rieske (2Fe-2S) protein [Corynebacterium epidermidicanis]|uniref:Ferredoxin subunit of nitrite reductase and ring-hydroxylating dioxygenase n=1 Tax=Corynebacterium epidermidicanis TaxID=1050174 RepID=A0A0G3GT88_9CORY|nr:Rieske 2Fe-2S domain-containing protein [Corynebacterium epidermidicanis]AKK04339.1 ferredoxin subunit of nitrite reductase and ring-hydroxylating dioxygenase [Corynebacterium epidermidicanis]
MTEHVCSRRLFLLGTATTFAGAVLAACGSEKGKEIAIQDVPVGGSIAVDGFIIAQPTAGVYKAYSQTCPHQGATISQLDGLKATCPKHTSVFDLNDGSVVSGPSRAPMKAAKAEKKGDKLSISG